MLVGADVAYYLTKLFLILPIAQAECLDGRVLVVVVVLKQHSQEINCSRENDEF